MFEIVKAERESAPIKAAFSGGSGSGKTYSALLFARGLVGPDGIIVVIDSEGGRSKIYADDPDIGGFHHLDLVEPYTSDRFRAAFKAATEYGAHVVVIDTISHEHEGFLEFADQEELKINGRHASRNKWIKPKAGRKRFYSALTSSHAHVVATVRVNRVVNMDKKPPEEIQKPECDKDFPYMMDLYVKILPDHKTEIIKVPKPLIGMVENGVFIETRHGSALAADSATRAQVATDTSSAIVARLEAAADLGPAAFREKWISEWKQAGPNQTKELLQTMTPGRYTMNDNRERLKLRSEGVASDQEDQSNEMETP